MTQPHEDAVNDLTSERYIEEITALHEQIEYLSRRHSRQVKRVTDLQQRLAIAIDEKQRLRVENAELKVAGDRRTRQVLVMSDPMGKVGL